MSMIWRKRVRLGVSASVLLAVCLACTMGSEEGERSTTGACPTGETCSEATPAGLTFWGHVLFDDPINRRLGPVLVGGTFDLGITSSDGSEVPPHAFVIEDRSTLMGVPGEGVFGPTAADGSPRYPVDGYMTLTGQSEGSSYVRVIDTTTGELFDRLLLDVYRVEDVQVRIARDTERLHVLAGCDEMLGVRLIARNGSTEIRAFDQNVTMRAGGVTVSDEPLFWDCFAVTVPEGRSELVVEVDVAGQTFSRSLEAKTLEEAGLAECPVIRD